MMLAVWHCSSVDEARCFLPPGLRFCRRLTLRSTQNQVLQIRDRGQTPAFLSSRLQHAKLSHDKNRPLLRSAVERVRGFSRVQQGFVTRYIKKHISDIGASLAKGILKELSLQYPYTCRRKVLACQPPSLQPPLQPQDMRRGGAGGAGDGNGNVESFQSAQRSGASSSHHPKKSVGFGFQGI